MKITQKEIVARYLASQMGQWVPGYKLQKLQTPFGWLGVDADTRAHELSREGYFESEKWRYPVEHRKQGKYAEFRIPSREEKNTPKTIVVSSNPTLDLPATLQVMEEYYEKL